MYYFLLGSCVERGRSNYRVLGDLLYSLAMSDDASTGASNRRQPAIILGRYSLSTHSTMDDLYSNVFSHRELQAIVTTIS